MSGLSGIRLRDYQQSAIEACHRAWKGEERGSGSGIARRVAVVLPTGAGKTVIFAHPDFRRPILAQRPGSRMLVLVHRDELAQQAVAKLHSIDPSASVGRVQNVWNETDREVIVASVQTLARAKRREQIRDVGLIVVDEAHHATARTYVEVLRHFGAFEGEASTPTAGFSATLARGDDNGKLGDVWEEVVLRRDVTDGIRQGWLVDVKGKRVQLEGFDLRSVKRTAGDYSDADLGEHLRSADAPEQVAQAYLELASDRQGVAFWPDVVTAEAGTSAMLEAGISTETILGSTHTDERAAAFERYRRGDTQVLSSCMVLTEGWDMPQASAAVIARPTQSAPLYVQMAGRVLRPWHAPTRYGTKRDALIIDVVGASGQHKLATIADLSVTTKIKPEAVDGDVSLLDAYDEAMAEAGVWQDIPVDNVTGKRIVTDVDLFGSSASLWMQTPRGTWFIPAADWMVFLWPESSGLWTLGVTPKNALPGQAQQLAAGLTLDWAMQHAERYAQRVVAERGKGVGTNSRNARWRTGPASPAQIAYARGLGCRFDTGDPLKPPSKADVSDAISLALATRALGG